MRLSAAHVPAEFLLAGASITQNPQSRDYDIPLVVAWRSVMLHTLGLFYRVVQHPRQGRRMVPCMTGPEAFVCTAARCLGMMQLAFFCIFLRFFRIMCFMGPCALLLCAVILTVSQWVFASDYCHRATARIRFGHQHFSHSV
jgi:hypothetical protein